MANVRQFKKDIDFVVNELVLECFTYSILFPEKQKDAIASLVADMINFGEDLIKKVNGVKSSADNSAKKQFSSLRKDFNNQINDFVSRISKLEKE